MTAAIQTGFVRKNKDTGQPEGTGEEGCLGYLKWAALYEPRTYLALLARILPFYINAEIPDDIMTREETLAELRARGLPLELIDHLRKAPTRLDDDEEEDPWGLRKKGITLDMDPAPGDTDDTAK